MLRAAVASLPLIERVAPPANVTPIDRPLRVAEVAEILRVSNSTIRSLVKEGILRGYTLSGRKGSEYRIPESAVREYVDSVAKVAL
jgi:excisionase family DNA binding protein